MQDIMLAAWQGIGGFEGRSSLRTWLYQIATNRCLNALRSARRRAPAAWSVSGVEPLEPSGLGEVTWLEPYPDTLLDASVTIPGPEARYEAGEAISLAFITALQVLPPRQRAVLILRDVLGFSAAETAHMLDATGDSVTSAPVRSAQARREPPIAPNSPAERDLVSRLTVAYQSGDVGKLVAMLTDDVRISMPPVPLEYYGRDLVARFNEMVTFRQGRTYDLIPMLVLTPSGDQICEITRFDNTVLPSFGLPRILP